MRVLQPRPQGSFPWLLEVGKSQGKRPGDEVGRYLRKKKTRISNKY